MPWRNEERVERRQRRARVAQQHGADAADVRRRPERVAPDDPVVRGVRLGEARVAVRLGRPVEGAVVDDDAADRCPVAADELGQRVDDDVRPVVAAPGEDGGRDGVVHDERQAEVVRRRRPGVHVDHVHARVADRLGEHEPRLVVHVPRQVARGVRVDEAHLDPVLRQRVGEEVVGAPVERRQRDDVVARARHVEHRVGHRGLPRGRHARGDAALERGDALLQHVPRRVHDARVDVARYPQAEQVLGVLGVVEGVADRLVDRHRAGVGGRVGRLAGVQGERLRPRGRGCGAHRAPLGIKSSKAVKNSGNRMRWRARASKRRGEGNHVAFRAALVPDRGPARRSWRTGRNAVPGGERVFVRGAR